VGGVYGLTKKFAHRGDAQEKQVRVLVRTNIGFRTVDSVRGRGSGVQKIHGLVGKKGGAKGHPNNLA